jgi:general secretion pathway protein D
MAVALGVSLGIAGNGPAPAAAADPAGAFGTVPADGTDAAPLLRRHQADELLGRAREAMKQNDLAAADALVSQAEALNVQYPAIYLGDTPAKARRDLERMKSAGGNPSLAERLFAPLGSGGKPAATDPFAGRMPESANDPPPLPAPPAERVAPLPPTGAGGASPAMFSEGADRTGRLAPAAPGDRARSDALLRAARRALAAEDVRQAADLAAQAKRLGLQYAPADDSPEKVDAAISRYVDVRVLDKRLEVNRRAYARMLLEQAEALIQWGEIALAEQLAIVASRQQVAYGPLEARPEDLLKRLGSLRQQYDRGMGAKQQVLELLQQSRQALNAGQLDRAEALARQAEQLHVPDSAFLPGEDRPALLLMDLAQARQRIGAVLRRSSSPDYGTPYGTGAAGPVVPAGGILSPENGVSRAYYDPARDPTRNIAASAQQGTASGLQFPENTAETIPAPPGRPVSATEAAAGPAVSTGYALFQEGEKALMAHQPERALLLYRQAAAYMNELDPVTAQRLQDHLQLLSAAHRPAARPGPAGSAVDEASAQQQALLKQVATDLAHAESSAKAMKEKDPKRAVAMLEDIRRNIASSALEPTVRDRMVKRVDVTLAELRQYIEQNRSRLELEEHNRGIRQDMTREERVREETQRKLAELVDKYTQLMREQRYDEAEVVVKQVTALAPDEPTARLLKVTGELRRNVEVSTRIMEDKEKGFIREMQRTDLAATPPESADPFTLPTDWKALTDRRHKYGEDRYRSPREREIEQRLKMPVSVSFQGKPLSQALAELSKITSVNIVLDEKGLQEENVSADTPVNLPLGSEISLRSVLNILLQSHNLCFLVEDEVLKVTSKELRSGKLIVRKYSVGDLVVPIPNFGPSPRMGVAGAYHDGMGVALGSGSQLGLSAPPMAAVASREGGRQRATISPEVLAQMTGRPAGAMGSGQPNTGGGGGAGGLGGAAAADFDDLIDLITQTVAPKSWEQNGGQGTIASFPTNLSLVVSQTQEVHEQITDLLEQLRRMQDLQVTIEVRFITLSDDFFERIGVDFDFSIRQNTTNPGQAGWTFIGLQPSGQSWSPPPAGSPTSIVGLQSGSNNPANPQNGGGIFTQSLDIPFQQGSYAQAVPQFGGSAAAFASGAQMGFAILSDIEAFFFINAAQGDARTNVLQAPKVTLFNGQQAFVSDTSQTPFVMSVIPVVADFVAAQQPVIVVLSEGTFMTVQAVVSNDHRFVRLTLVPFFSKIGNVQTFQFQGSTTTTSDTTRQGLLDAANHLFNNNNDQKTVINSGVSVQLPTFSFVTVTTTVSVPDGGTVLLGGVKRLSEDREEFGVPILDKIPYLNRLFKNVGIGRATSSLLLMVTPRIIIQEEEEEKLGIAPSP